MHDSRLQDYERVGPTAQLGELCGGGSTDKVIIILSRTYYQKPISSCAI